MRLGALYSFDFFVWANVWDASIYVATVQRGALKGGTIRRGSHVCWYGVFLFLSLCMSRALRCKLPISPAGPDIFDSTKLQRTVTNIFITMPFSLLVLTIEHATCKACSRSGLTLSVSFSVLITTGCWLLCCLAYLENVCQRLVTNILLCASWQ